MKTPSEMSGLALRECVATEIMGVQVIHYNKHDDPNRPCTTVVIPGGVNQIDFCGTLALSKLRKAIPAYESSIEAAFAVVEKLEAAKENWLFRAVRQCGVLTRQVDKVAWMCEFRACIGPANHVFYAIGVDEQSLPLAICRAALQAVRAAK